MEFALSLSEVLRADALHPTFGHTEHRPLRIGSILPDLEVNHTSSEHLVAIRKVPSDFDLVENDPRIEIF